MNDHKLYNILLRFKLNYMGTDVRMLLHRPFSRRTRDNKANGGKCPTGDEACTNDPSKKCKCHCKPIFDPMENAMEHNGVR